MREPQNAEQQDCSPAFLYIYLIILPEEAENPTKSRQNFKLYKVMDNKNKEELQSRREFFKSAAKAALPVLAIAVLGSPVLTSCDKKNEPSSGSSSGCGNSCSGSCSKSCSGGCDGGCSGDCDDGCTADCWNGCDRWMK